MKMPIAMTITGEQIGTNKYPRIIPRNADVLSERPIAANVPSDTEIITVPTATLALLTNAFIHAASWPVFIPSLTHLRSGKAVQTNYL